MKNSKKMPYNAFCAADGYVDPNKTQNKFCNGVLKFCTAILNLASPRNFATLSNEAEDEAEIDDVFTNFVDLSNEGDGWYLVAPFGDTVKRVRNSDGTTTVYHQRFDAAAAARIVADFRSLWSRLKTAVGNPCPVYFGHPDEEALAVKYPDKTPYGKIQELEARECGLFAKIKWLQGFEELPKRLRFSPRWTTEIEDGALDEKIATPFALRSVGITDNPNIKTADFANEDFETQQKEYEMLKNILIALGFTEADAQNIADGKSGALPEADVMKKVQDLQTAADAAGKPTAKETQLEADLANEKKKCLANEDAFKAERLAHAKLIVSNCVEAGKILQGEADKKIETLANSADFETLSAEYASRPVAVKVKSATGGIGKDDKKTLSNEASVKFKDLIAEKMSKGIPYETAWHTSSKEHPEVFASAFPKETE